MSENNNDDDDDGDELYYAAELVDVAQQSSMRELEVAHLRESDEQCTHAEGYVTQALWACRTCYRQSSSQSSSSSSSSSSSQSSTEPAALFGVCAACMAVCHEGHQLYELFDKRDFKCDCGTPRSRCCCSFAAETGGQRAEDNAGNVYNQNFNGTYCWCRRPYLSADGTMYMCTVCQDWFHERCIINRSHSQFPDPFSWNDFICVDCVRKDPWLLRYEQLHQGTVRKSLPPVSNVPESIVHDRCVLPPQRPSPAAKQPRNLFWIQGWKRHLCRCAHCLARLQRNNLSFLIRDADAEQDEEEAADDDNNDNDDDGAELDSGNTVNAGDREQQSRNTDDSDDADDKYREDDREQEQDSDDDSSARPSSQSRAKRPRSDTADGYDPSLSALAGVSFDAASPESLFEQIPYRPQSPDYDPSIENEAMQAFTDNPTIRHQAKLDAIRAFCELSRKFRAFLRQEVIARDAVVTRDDVLNFFSDEALKRQRQK